MVLINKDDLQAVMDQWKKENVQPMDERLKQLESKTSEAPSDSGSPTNVGNETISLEQDKHAPGLCEQERCTSCGPSKQRYGREVATATKRVIFGNLAEAAKAAGLSDAADQLATAYEKYIAGEEVGAEAGSVVRVTDG